MARALLAAALAWCALLSAEAFVSPLNLPLGSGRARSVGSGALAKGARRGATRGGGVLGAARMAIEEVEYVKIFGRLGEKTLMGDASAGACCHSGCDNCEWRYSFDIMQSARPKWIPTYRECKFEDGREHVAKWSSLFEGNEPVDKQAFIDGILDLKFEMPLGPSGFLTAKQAVPSQEALEMVFFKLAKGKPTLTPRQMGMRLKKMVPPTMDPTGLMWTDFVCALQEEDEEEEIEELEPIVIN